MNLRAPSPALSPDTPPPPAQSVAWAVPVLAFLTILVDGFDTTSIGFVVPTLAREWGLAPAAFTPAFVGTSLGAVLGYMLSGRASARFGRRAVVLAAVAGFGLGSCATALVGSVMQLALLRLLTGIGLGAAIPACISLAVEHASPQRREAMALGVAAGLAMGATLGGALGGRLIAQWGWSAIFWLGGLLPALLLPLLWLGLPRDRAHGVAPPGGPRSPAAVSSLFSGGLAGRTSLLWSFSFMVFTATYAMSFWAPTLLLNFGFGPNDVALGSAAVGGGGLVAALVLVPLAAWRGIRPVLVVTSALAVACIACLARAEMSQAAVLFTLGAVGACLIAGTLGQAALAVSLYGPDTRTTGVGWAAALGRVGSIVGPGLGGALLAGGHAPRDVILTLCLPMGLAVGALLMLGRQKR